MNAPFKPEIVTDPEASREWALEEYHEWVREGIRGLRECDNNPREDADFDEFLTARAQPHMIDADRYAAAMEDPFDRALSLVDLSRGNRRESDASYTLEDHIASLRDEDPERWAEVQRLWDAKP